MVSGPPVMALFADYRFIVCDCLNRADMVALKSVWVSNSWGLTLLD